MKFLKNRVFICIKLLKTFVKEGFLFVGENIFDLTPVVEFQCFFKKIFLNVMIRWVFIKHLQRAASHRWFMHFWFCVWSAHLWPGLSDPCSISAYNRVWYLESSFLIRNLRSSKATPLSTFIVRSCFIMVTEGIKYKEPEIFITCVTFTCVWDSKVTIIM